MIIHNLLHTYKPSQYEMQLKQTLFLQLVVALNQQKEERQKLTISFINSKYTGTNESTIKIQITMSVRKYLLYEGYSETNAMPTIS